MAASPNASNEAWAMIEQEKRRDRFIRRVSVTAWTVTFLILLVFTTMIGSNVLHMAKAARVGAVSWSSVVGMAMPLIIVLGLLSLLVATLGTIGIFLRLRTASLAEIQLRLGALEDMLSARPDAKNA
jgi:uncharacterized BrkB/YihY/UPF0761 family membrane protein